jgi:hypothetical protein
MGREKVRAILEETKAGVETTVAKILSWEVDLLYPEGDDSLTAFLEADPKTLLKMSERIGEIEFGSQPAKHRTLSQTMVLRAHDTTLQKRGSQIVQGWNPLLGPVREGLAYRRRALESVKVAVRKCIWNEFVLKVFGEIEGTLGARMGLEGVEGVVNCKRFAVETPDRRETREQVEYQLKRMKEAKESLGELQ